MPSKKLPLKGILKHANVCRILVRNQIAAHEFYIIARVCAENLPPATLVSLHHEMTIYRPKGERTVKNAHMTTRTRVFKMVQRGLLQIIKDGRETIVEATDMGWRFFILTLAEMERPVRDCTVFDSKKKLDWRRGARKFGKREQKARASFSIVKAAKPKRLTLWQRCGAEAIPKFQKIKTTREKKHEATN